MKMVELRTLLRSRGLSDKGRKKVWLSKQLNFLSIMCISELSSHLYQRIVS